MADNKPTLNALREQIDDIDQSIQQLIVERVRCAQAVAACKGSDQQGATFYRPEREAQVLRKVQARSCDPVNPKDMALLFREIMSVCLAVEKPVKVAYLGPEGTFTQQAANKHFGRSAEFKPLRAIDEVFREVEAGAVDYGVVPVENSSEGVVTHTLDNFLESPLQICGEVVVRIHHNFLVSSVTERKNITRVYSHAQSLAQCRKWLNANFPNIERIALNSNAEAAKRVHHEWNAAAIAGDMAAELYQLETVSEKIEDQPNNTTRFLIIGREATPASGLDKTSVVLSVNNRPGVLHECLQPFQQAGIDLTRVESRPSKSGSGIWNYVFFIDFEGHSQQPLISDILQQLQNHAQVKLLGSYPVSVL